MATVRMTREQFKQRWERFKIGVAIDMVQALQRRCPVDTGKTRSSIKYDITSKGIVISMDETAIWIEFGTAPHIIRPKDKKALKFKVGGKDVFAKEVHHPGTRPQPFIRTTFRNDLSTIVMNNARRHFK